MTLRANVTGRFHIDIRVPWAYDRCMRYERSTPSNVNGSPQPRTDSGAFPFDVA